MSTSALPLAVDRDATSMARLAPTVFVVDDAVGKCTTIFEGQVNLRALREDYASLSARERQVMALVTSGFLNKQVGVRLGISEITVKAHRGHLMRKMQARSFAELVNMAARLGLHDAPDHPRSTAAG